MRITVCRAGNNETLAFALEEFRRYLYKIDSSIDVEPFYYDAYTASRKNTIWLVVSPELAPAVTDPSMDDAFRISIKDNAGIIAGTNPVSVLIGVYSLLKKLGCKWIRPGRDGELIEEKTLAPLNFEYEEKADYRFRGIDMAGSNSTQTATDLIDWLPKEGMNNYYVEGLTPGGSFKSYFHYLDFERVDWGAAFNTVALEAKRRGLKRHACGHGWHISALNYQGNARAPGLSIEDLTPEQRECVALRDGKRELYLGNKLNSTQLCYSKAHLRSNMTEHIVKYLKEHPGIDYLHFWLADGVNNHCECDQCRKHLPSDWYVLILNELDKRLQAEGITSRIVCLIYVDLLWEPVDFKIENPDRYILMFAPISRTYDTSYSDLDQAVQKMPYIRNRLVFPRSAAENAAYLRDWQEKQLKGDSFLFDYHLMWNQYKEPGYRHLSRVIYEDMHNLVNLGLGGNISCEVYASQIPHDFPHRIMARTLWNRNLDYYAEEKEYFWEAFGEDHGLVFDYLSSITDAFSIIYRYYNDREKTHDDQEALASRVAQAVSAFKPVIENNLAKALPRAQHISWELLALHADYLVPYAHAYCAKYMGDVEASERYLVQFNAVCDRIHEKYDKYFNLYYSKFSVKFYCDEITENGANIVLQ